MRGIPTADAPDALRAEPILQRPHRSHQAEDRAVVDPCLPQPDLQGADRAAVRVRGAGELQHVLPNLQHHPRRCEAQMLTVERHQGGTPQRRGLGQQEQCPVAPPGQVLAAVGQQRPECGLVQRRGGPRWGHRAGDKPAEGGADRRLGRIPRVAAAAVPVGDRRQPATQAARAEPAGQARQLLGDVLRRGRQRRLPGGGAPSGKCLPVGSIGAADMRRL